MMEELIIAAVSPSYSSQHNQNKASDRELCGVSSSKTQLFFSFKNTQIWSLKAAQGQVPRILKWEYGFAFPCE